MLRSVLMTTCVLLGSVISSSSSSSSIGPPRTYDHGIGVGTSRPLNIGHRGASGVFPEHTRPAYERAIADGADVIECDVVVSRDARLICRHEPWLSTSTDIAQHSEFADRRRTIVDFDYYGTPRNITDWFIVDFTLAELQTLRTIQVNAQRDPGMNGKYAISTLADYIHIAQTANRTIGIYPELKHPRWVNSLALFNISFEELVVQELVKHGYEAPTDACIIQSFEFDSLQALSTLTKLPLVMLVEKPDQVTSALLDQYTRICYGVGIWKGTIVDHYDPANGYKNRIRNVIRDVPQRIRARRMKIHAYTFRNEDRTLAWDFEQDPWKEYDLYMELGVDGYFTDFPGTLDRYLDAAYREKCTGRNDPVGNSSPPALTVFLLTFCTMIMVGMVY